MTIRMVQPMTTLPNVNEQSGANTLTIASAGTTVTKEFRELSNFENAAFFLDVTAISGTTPTLDVTIQVQDPISNKWSTLATFPQQTAVTAASPGRPPVLSALPGVNYRAQFVVGGTGPSVSFSLGVVLRTSEPIPL